MEKEYLYKYLLNSSSRPDCIELLQYCINRKIYHYGDNFISPFSIYNRRNNILRDIYHFLVKVKGLKGVKSSGPRVISNAYFTFNTELKRIGFEPFSPFWASSNNSPYLNDIKLLNTTGKIEKHLEFAPLDKIVCEPFYKVIDDYKEDVLKLIKRFSISSVIFSNDLGFHERLFIDIFKYLGKPSFIFSHGGSPIVYNGIDDNRTKYLVVWGEAIKQEYILSGIPAEKILVSGHPRYAQPPQLAKPFSTEDILVLSKAPQGAPTDSTKVSLFDKGNGIVYIKMIEDILKAQGIKKARLRLHPSENPEWYAYFIDNNFFTIDRSSLFDSLEKASLIIGGTTSVFQESLYFGKPYIVFEPTDITDTDVYGIKLRSPFDGSISKVPVCKSVDQLDFALKNRVVSDNSIINDYFMTPFDISFIKNLIS